LASAAVYEEFAADGVTVTGYANCRPGCAKCGNNLECEVCQNHFELVVTTEEGAEIPLGFCRARENIHAPVSAIEADISIQTNVCASTEFLDRTECVTCNTDNCLTCFGSADNCTSCNEGYMLVYDPELGHNYCSQCAPGQIVNVDGECVYAEDTHCAFYEGSECKKCSDFETVPESGDSSGCTPQIRARSTTTSCSSGFYYDSVAAEC
jgi:hypothetical protein